MHEHAPGSSGDLVRPVVICVQCVNTLFLVIPLSFVLSSDCVWQHAFDPLIWWSALIRWQASALPDTFDGHCLSDQWI